MSSISPNLSPGPPLPSMDMKEEKESTPIPSSRSIQQDEVPQSPIPPALQAIQDSINNIIRIEIRHRLFIIKDGKEESIADKDFKPYEKLLAQGVKAYEYFSKNKDNILKLVQKFVPQSSEWTDFWLNKSDNAGKWSEPVILTFFYLSKYFSILQVQRTLKENQKTFDTYIQDRKALLESSAKDSSFVKEIQKTIAQANCHLNVQLEEAYAKGFKPFRNLFSKMLVFPLEIVKVSEKIAAKISKSAYSLFKGFALLWNLHESDSLQEKSLQHLQPRITVKIFKSFQRGKTSHESIQKKLSSKEETFVNTLRGCRTIAEVQAELKEIGCTLFKLPDSIEAFRRDLIHERHFQYQLLERYNYYETQQDLDIQIKNWRKSLLACKTIEAIQAKLKAIGCSFNIPVDIEEFKTLLDGSSRFKDQLVSPILQSLRSSTTIGELQAKLEAIGCSLEELQAELREKGDSFPESIANFKMRLVDDGENAYFRKQLFSAIVKSFLPCHTIEEAQAKLSIIGCSFHIPADIEAFRELLDGSPRFKDQLTQSYQHFLKKRITLEDLLSLLKQGYQHSHEKRITKNDNHIIELLNKKKQIRDDKIRQYMPTLKQEIANCHNKTFEEIKTHFVNLHINIDRIKISHSAGLTLPPTTLPEWEACIRNEEFLQALAGQWVDFQETSAQLLLQATRQALLSKHDVERKFLFFKALKHTIEIFSSVTQMIFSLFNLKTGLLAQVSYVVEVLTKDIPKLGNPWLGIMYIFHPVYAKKFNLKLESFCMLLAKHFFAIRYKPNEYSFESYRLEVEAYRLTFVAWWHYLFFQIKQAALWMNIRLIENCVMRNPKQPLIEDKRYQSLAEEYAEDKKKDKKREEDLKQELVALKIKDAKLIVSPILKSMDGSSRDVLQIMHDSLKEMNIDYLSPELQELFEDNLGFKLANDNKAQFQEHLQKLLIENEEDFILCHASNRFHYLKGLPQRTAVHNAV